MSEDQAAGGFLMNIIMSAWVGPALWTTVRLGVPERLSQGPTAAQELAGAVGADADCLERVLNALSSIGVFKRAGDGRFAATAVSEMLRPDHPSQLRYLVDTGLGGENYLAWASLEAAVRTGGCAFDIQHGMHWVPYFDQHPDRREVFASAMTATTRATEEALLASWNPGAFSLAVDIGGGNGGLISGLLARHTQARGVVFDLPQTVAAGHALWADTPIAERLEAVGGDFFESVPEGDLYLLKLILHDWRDPEAIAILKSVRRAMRPGGRVAIIETVLPDDGRPHPAWGMDIAMMACSGGRERTQSHYESLLRQAGFSPLSCTPTPAMYSVVEAVGA